MDMQIETDPSEINSYEQYLATFFPHFLHDINEKMETANEIGLKMAEETLTRIRDLLTE